MNQRTYIIAEAGVNHNGDMNLAKQLIDAAAAAGADAVKFQTFTAAKLVTPDAEKATYQKINTGNEDSQHSMLLKLELPYDEHAGLAEHARTRGIAFLSSPFDAEAADFLVNKLHLPTIKIPSGEITNAQLLLRVARSGADVILSTGMSDLEDIERALAVLAFGYTSKQAPSLAEFKNSFQSAQGHLAISKKVLLLHCTSDYPAKMEQLNLHAMQTLRDAFGTRVGYSDHSEGVAIPFAAVAMGAECIEKHFTLDRRLPGPDHRASLEPHELKQMVEGIRDIEKAKGSSLKRPQAGEIDTRRIARKSLVTARKIVKGDTFDETNLTSKRPGTGVSPIFYWDVIGCKATRDYAENELLTKADLNV